MPSRDQKASGSASRKSLLVTSLSTSGTTDGWCCHSAIFSRSHSRTGPEVRRHSPEVCCFGSTPCSMLKRHAPRSSQSLKVVRCGIGGFGICRSAIPARSVCSCECWRRRSIRRAVGTCVARFVKNSWPISSTLTQRACTDSAAKYSNQLQRRRGRQTESLSGSTVR